MTVSNPELIYLLSLIAYVQGSSMEVAEAMDSSRSPLAAVSLSQQNTEADVDFSRLTPSQFGISTQSFLPSSNVKGTQQ